MNKFGKIHRHHWKERLKVESDLLKANEDTAPQSSEILQTFVWWEGGGGRGHKLVSHHTNFCIFSQLYRAISFSLKSYHSEIWKFRQTLFIGVDEFSLPGPYSLKSWKNREKVYFGSPWRIPPLSTQNWLRCGMDVKVHSLIFYAFLISFHSSSVTCGL